MLDVILAILGILLSAIFAGAEAAFTIFNKLRLEIWKKQKAPLLKPLLFFHEHPESFFSTILFGNNVANILTTTFATVFLIRFLDKGTSWLIITFSILVFGEIIPKSLFRALVNIVIRPVVFIVYIFFWILSPFIKLLNILVDWVLSLFRIQHETTHYFFLREELELLLKEGLGGEEKDNPELKYIDKILDFGSIKVREAMTPRTELVAVPVTTDMETLKEQFTKHGVMHIPVFENNLDNVIGIVFLYDLFDAPRSIRDILKPLEMVPENISCARLMHEFKEKNISVALVVDEYGGTAGLVTMDDLIDTMFGDFPEAFEKMPQIRALNKHTWLLDASFPLDELQDIVHVSFPPGDYETIAGLILQKTGRIPQVNEEIAFNDFRIVVTKSTKRKILQVKLIKNVHQ